MSLFPEFDCGADFSPCGRYRYRLWRNWGPEPRRLVNWIMLNPSTASEMENDPTVERCERRTREWGFSGLLVTNLFAFRATDPRDMLKTADPVGPENDRAILTAAGEAALRICAWGTKGSFMGRDRKVLAVLEGLHPHTLRITKGGMPEHPLYLPYELRPIPYAH